MPSGDIEIRVKRSTLPDLVVVKSHEVEEVHTAIKSGETLEEKAQGVRRWMLRKLAARGVTEDEIAQNDGDLPSPADPRQEQLREPVEKRWAYEYFLAQAQSINVEGFADLAERYRADAEEAMLELLGPPAILDLVATGEAETPEERGRLTFHSVL